MNKAPILYLYKEYLNVYLWADYEYIEKHSSHQIIYLFVKINSESLSFLSLSY